MKGRKRIRLSAPNYMGPGRYFVTACTRHHIQFFASPSLAELTVQAFQRAATAENFLLHAWCVMPDHVHALVEGTSKHSGLFHFVNHWKCATREDFRQSNPHELWQASFFDRTLRATDSPYPIAWYIWLNPVRKGLCEDPTAYPWSGSMTMDWKSMMRPNETWIPPWKEM